MKLGLYLIIRTLILFSCGVRKSQTIADSDVDKDAELDTTVLDEAIATEAWMDFDNDKQVSFVDIYKFGQIRIPGKWYHSSLRSNQQSGRFVYENKDKEILIVDLGIPDTMSFYKKGMTNKEFVNKLYEQGISFWKGKEAGQIETIEENSDNVIGKLTVEPTKQIFYLFGLREKKSMTIYFISPVLDDNQKVVLLKKVFNG
jgi:hypothetical protein